jgi:hypothetical protein
MGFFVGFMTLDVEALGVVFHESSRRFSRFLLWLEMGFSDDADATAVGVETLGVVFPIFPLSVN